MTYQSTTDRAAIVRKTLKDSYGYSSRQVSVRSDSFSMGSSIDVTIKDPSVNYAVVEAVASGQESIRRDEYSGEILSGGNRYVSVSYSREAEKALAAPYFAPLQAAMDRLAPGSNVLEPVVGNVLVGITGNGGYQLWTDRAGMNFGSQAEAGAFTVARYIEDAKPAPEPGDFKAKAKSAKAKPVTLKPAPRQPQTLTLTASLLA
jgi:hypothetical protein